jgi:glucose-6-phosphate isomerase
MAHAADYKAKSMSAAQSFSENANRFNQFSVQLGDLLFDYSKQKITAKTMTLLLELAKAAQLSDKIEALFTGDRLNAS